MFEQQSSLANEIHDLEQQHLIASTSARELDEDYIFAVENVPSDSLECPLCGVEHDNSLLSRAGLLADKEGLEQQVSSIKIALEDKYRQRTELTEELNFVTSEIERINEKYLKRILLKRNLMNNRRLSKHFMSFLKRKSTVTLFRKKKAICFNLNMLKKSKKI
ncbi:hypothetical protein Q8W16_15455 [Photobacterium damselae subsp. piscicida]|nr:hypothetical protein [Photobacterium damselae subsp. piscicida]